MNIITLTTDFGITDFYVATIKGIIYSEFPDCNIVDITHNIDPFDLLQTAYVLRSSYKYFPKGTVHIITVDSFPHPDLKTIVAEIDGQYFICNDNGVLSLIASNMKPTRIIEIKDDNPSDKISIIKDLFIPIAFKLAKGEKIEKMGEELDNIKESIPVKPIIKENSLSGLVIYIDNFGNSITNIHKDYFDEFVKDKKFVINARNYQFFKIMKNYTDIVEDYSQEQKYHGKEFAMFNDVGYLQISIYKSNLKTVGGASTLMGLNIGSTVNIVFD